MSNYFIPIEDLNHFFNKLDINEGIYDYPEESSEEDQESSTEESSEEEQESSNEEILASNTDADINAIKNDVHYIADTITLFFLFWLIIACHRILHYSLKRHTD